MARMNIKCAVLSTFVIWIVLSPPGAMAASTLLELGNTRFQVETALTEEEHRRGLMKRPSLPAKTGMLFIYPTPTRVSFWMKDTLIPLDLLFFDQNGRLVQYMDDLPPCLRDDCPRYNSNGYISYALELQAGTRRRLGVDKGAEFHIVMP